MIEQNGRVTFSESERKEIDAHRKRQAQRKPKGKAIPSSVILRALDPAKRRKVVSEEGGGRFA